MGRLLNRTGLVARTILSVGRAILTILAILMIVVGVAGWGYTRVASSSPAMAKGLIVALLALLVLVAVRLLVNRRKQ